MITGKMLLAVGTAAGMKKDVCRQIAEDIQERVTRRLGQYLRHQGIV